MFPSHLPETLGIHVFRGLVNHLLCRLMIDSYPSGETEGEWVTFCPTVRTELFQKVSFILLQPIVLCFYTEILADIKWGQHFEFSSLGEATACMKMLQKYFNKHTHTHTQKKTHMCMCFVCTYVCVWAWGYVHTYVHRISVYPQAQKWYTCMYTITRIIIYTQIKICTCIHSLQNLNIQKIHRKQLTLPAPMTFSAM